MTVSYLYALTAFICLLFLIFLVLFSECATVMHPPPPPPSMRLFVRWPTIYYHSTINQHGLVFCQRAKSFLWSQRPQHQGADWLDHWSGDCGIDWAVPEPVSWDHVQGLHQQLPFTWSCKSSISSSLKVLCHNFKCVLNVSNEFQFWWLFIYCFVFYWHCDSNF